MELSNVGFFGNAVHIYPPTLFVEDNTVELSFPPHVNKVLFG